MATPDTSAHVSGDAVDVGPVRGRGVAVRSTAPRTGCARSTATSPGTTSCAPTPSTTAAPPCTPTRRTTRGCSRDSATPTAGRPGHGRPDRGLFERACRDRQPRPATPAPPAPAVTRRHRSGQGGEVRRVHAGERRQRLPGPERVGRVRLLELSMDPARCSRRPSTRARTCSHRAPGAQSATPSSSTAGLRFARCVRENGVKDFPDPVNGEPLINTYRIPSSNQPGGMTILNAATKKCGDLWASSGGPVRRKTGCRPQRPSWLPRPPPAAWS